MAGRAGRVRLGLLVVLFPALFTLFLFAVFVVQVAASSAGNASEGGSGKGILIEDDSSGDTGGRADGRTGGEMLFLGAAGGKRKGKDGYGESRKYSVHVFLVVAARAMRASRAEPLFFACAILIQEGAETVTP
jgi:hypothetical protein